MAGMIRELSAQLVNKIAAGEVIVRPASVVKELVENAIDADAARLTVSISNEARDITVTDDGRGMIEEDARLCLKRHSTSKIASFDDITSLATRGFRGEALASIAAVSRLEIITRREDSLSGVRVRCEGGGEIDIARIGAPHGTTVHVRDLFYNTPVRRKFLKSPVSEINQSIQMVTRQALTRPEIGFSFSKNSQKTIDLAPNQTLRQRMLSLLGSDLDQHCLEIALDTTPTKIRGFITKPSMTRKDRRYQLFFVNARPITHPTLSFALEEAYKGLLMTGRHPITVLFLSVPFEEVDVNVHPTKEEVRFKNERVVMSIIHKAAAETLREANLIPRLVTEDERARSSTAPSPTTQSDRSLPGIFKTPQEMLKDQFVKKFGETQPQSTPDFLKLQSQPAVQMPSQTKTSSEAVSRQSHLPEQFETSVESIPEPSEASERELWEKSNPPRPVGQIGNMFIVAEWGDDLLIIDQHAAHERILYTLLSSRRSKPDIQPLMVPIEIEVPTAEVDNVHNLIPVLGEMGVEIEHFGGTTFLVRSLPSVDYDFDVGEMVHDLLDDLAHSGKNADTETARQKALISMACHMAIRSGQALQQEEMERLIKEIRETRLAFTCPHGRPTMVLITRRQLEKQFKRV